MNLTTLIGMILPGLATGLGGLAVYLVARPSPRLLDTLLGGTAGVMLAALGFSLLVPALDDGELWEVLLGFAAGGAAIALVDGFMPHLHERFVPHERSAEQRRIDRRGWMVLAALTIHNVPEGLAVGVAFAAGGPELGVPLAIAIGMQNIPEGTAAAVPLVAAGRSRRAAALTALASGAVEPLAAFIAYGVVELVGGILPFALAFAAAAMLYVVVDELLPEAHERGYYREASLALLVGFAVMMALDNAFG